MIYTSEEIKFARKIILLACNEALIKFITSDRMNRVTQLIKLVVQWEYSRQIVRYRPGGIIYENHTNEVILKHGCVEFKADFIKELRPKENPPPDILPPLNQS